MALAINIEDLLNKQKIESNRIEFKKGWNPASIYHSVCAFANDFDDLGGGYIVVGVDTDDDTGMAIRPVEGVPVEKIDGILQEMVGYNNKMSPVASLPRVRCWTNCGSWQVACRLMKGVIPTSKWKIYQRCCFANTW